MKEFIGLVIYPFLFSTSLYLVSTDRFTHASMSRTGTEVMSFVNILSAAVSFGVLGLSPFPAFAFFDFGIAFGLDLAGVCGELDGTMFRPLRVRSSR